MIYWANQQRFLECLLHEGTAMKADQHLSYDRTYAVHGSSSSDPASPAMTQWSARSRRAVGSRLHLPNAMPIRCGSDLVSLPTELTGKRGMTPRYSPFSTADFWKVFPVFLSDVHTSSAVRNVQCPGRQGTAFPRN
ncbi:unnamed protein product [Cladocopium goreaui]|uniref:Uncharacterized protein n=1 Tax=Cladocopium goreaui TaxID=2562237 RepID=A0A9P1CBZ3_9DINO|nr:unnamed protein product [Cladocopium goreaui]